MAASNTTALAWAGSPLARKPGTSRAEFRAAWLRHGALASPWFQKNGIQTYSQLHIPDVSAGADPSTEDGKLLGIVDGIAVLQHTTGETLAWIADGGNPYRDLILADEHRFLHDECGAGAVQRNPPNLTLPQKTVPEWREWALRLGATEHPIIVAGEVVVDVPPEVMDDFKRIHG